MRDNDGFRLNLGLGWRGHFGGRIGLVSGSVVVRVDWRGVFVGVFEGMARRRGSSGEGGRKGDGKIRWVVKEQKGMGKGKKKEV